MKYREIKELSKKDLAKLLREKREEVRSLQFKSANRQLGNVKSIGKAKADIARLLTALKIQK